VNYHLLKAIDSMDRPTLAIVSLGLLSVGFLVVFYTDAAPEPPQRQLGATRTQPGATQQDTRPTWLVITKSGQRHRGRLVDDGWTEVVLEVSYGGQVTIRKSEIESTQVENSTDKTGVLY
jgi:hypothetical protein